MGEPSGRQHPTLAHHLTLDAGALIALDRGNQRVRALARAIHTRGGRLVVPACALAQAWRDGSRQTELARLLKATAAVVEELDGPRARAVGELCGRRATSDIADAFVAIVAAMHGGTVVTGDPDDLLRLAPGLAIIPID